jgi:hypothetical protein
MKLSGCVITFNEEVKIEACLRSLDFCDEIVVVDSYSTDKTVKLVRQIKNDKNFKVPIKIFFQKFLGHVGQKNFIITKTSFDWIFALDADERASSKLKQSILDLKRNNDTECTAFECNRLTFYVNSWIKHGGWYPDKKIRLFKKGLGKWEGENPHDYYNPGKNKKCHLAGDILHYSFDSISDHIQTIDSFTSIAAKEAYESGKRTNLLSIIGHSMGIFLKMLFLKLGFLDGSIGIILAGLSSFHVWTKYSKIWMLQKEEKKKEKSEK